MGSGQSVVWPRIRDDEAFGNDVITKLAMHHRQQRTGVIGQQLPEQAVGDLYVWMMRAFPPKEDPDRDGAHWVDPREAIGDLRDNLLRRLQERGTRGATETIRWIADQLPDQKWLRNTALSADRTRLWQSWSGIPPQAIFALIANKFCRIVETDEQLLRAISESLVRLERKLHGETAAVVDLWNGDAPKDEEDLSNYVKRHLDEDLRSVGALAFREAEIRRGQETDIFVAAIATRTANRCERVSVILEVKGCWNPGLTTSMSTQLKNRYLNERGGCGLYLVGWFLCDKWRDEDRRVRTVRLGWTLEQARNYFTEQAKSLNDGASTLAAFVLDAARRR